MQIHGLRRADVLRSHSPVRSAPALDSLELRETTDPGVYGRQHFSSSSSQNGNAFAKAVWGLVLTTSVAGVLGMAPQVSMAAEATEDVKQQGLAMLARSKAAKGEMISLQEGLQRLKPAAREELSKVPPGMQEVFVNLSPQEMRWMHGQLNGTKWVAIIPVDKRAAFIQGEALGRDVYQMAVNGLKKQIAQGTLPAEMEGRLTDVILQVKSMTPEQRASLMNALDAQVR